MKKKNDTRYWHLIAKSIDAENMKLQFFVRDKHSLGIGRESILRGLLIAQTPEPLRVKTGFVANTSKEFVVSDQCDILVYDPRDNQPLFRIDEFVVVPDRAARAVIEVRSELDSSGLHHMFKIRDSMKKFPIRTEVFGFAYHGLKFASFVAAVAKGLRGDVLAVPGCIAVHENNYFCVRVTNWLVRANPPRPDPKLCVAIDLGRSDANKGLATNYFLNFYDARIRRDYQPNLHFTMEAIGSILDTLKLPKKAVCIIDESGNISHDVSPFATLGGLT